MSKNLKNKNLLRIILAFAVIAAILLIPKLTGKTVGVFLGITGAEQAQSESVISSDESSPQEAAPDERGRYTSKEDVLLYLQTYGKLPSNFITKDKARKLGWDGGDLSEYAPGKSIGGDVFGNREGSLPDESGRSWYECDINYNGGSRGAERIVFSNDGLIYYTDDHYETFTKLN